MVTHLTPFEPIRHDRPVIVVLRYQGTDLLAPLDEALAALARTNGFEEGWIGRAPDDPTVWLLTARWADAGAMRHGLGSFAVKVALGPLQAHSAPGDVVVEELVMRAGEAAVRRASDLAGDAGRARPRDDGSWSESPRAQ